MREQLHWADKGRIVFEVDDEVMLACLNALHVFIVEVCLDEGLIMRRVADGRFIDGKDLGRSGGTL